MAQGEDKEVIEQSFAAVLRHASRRSLRCGRQIFVWIDKKNHFHATIAARKSQVFFPVCRVIGEELFPWS